MAERSGIVTLTTDFGTADGFVGAMKGVIVTLFAAARVIDVTHEIAPFDVRGGALALRAAAPFFPAGTVHVAVVDPGVGTSRAPVVVEAGGQIYVGPDNGLFDLLGAPARVHAISTPPFVAERPAPTFHGRDLFARTGALVAAGADLGAAGPATTLQARLALPSPRPIAGAVAGEVLHVDRFGNLVTNLPGDAPRGSTLRIGNAALPLRRTFGEVEQGEPVAYLGSSGFLEIAVREGRADVHFAARPGTAVVLRHPR